MTDHEKAVKYAQAIEWYKTHLAESRKSAREWYARNKTKANNASWRYDQTHYQERLEYFRDRHRKLNDANRKIPYKARLSRRVPDYAENAAHARHLMRDIRPMSVSQAFAHGVFSM